MGIKMKKMMTVPKTIEGLRDAIFDEINQLRSGKGNLQQARAVAQLSAQAIDSMRVQIQYGRMVMQAKNEKPLQLGSDQT
ncbi:MAG: hypothetical protein A2X97_14085 [Bdellovibrionales bacterium GWA1_52_35]|nr:MAG: hypothetical protein A2X97_14085 [Bdellovibrionales bacterium GWA1_52_35]